MEYYTEDYLKKVLKMTRNLIKKHFNAPDLITIISSVEDCEVNLYKTVRINEVIQSDDFIVDLNKVEKRREYQKRRLNNNNK